jgi:septum formation protein
MLLLASQSPRRRELLDQIGMPHEVIRVKVNEDRLPGETPEDYVHRLAVAKARAGSAGQKNGTVLGADTAVVVDDQILGKPRNQDHALQMLMRLSDQEHRVLTGVALLTDDNEYYRLSSSTVRMRFVSPTEALSYWRSGEPADKAGAYAIQGKGAVFISHLSGSYSGVMGLPLFETAELLGLAGLFDAKLTI